MMILKNCTFYNELFEKEFGDIEIENGRIKQIGIINEDGKDMDGLIIIPGFVDIHIHGCGGGDASDASDKSLEKMCNTLKKVGVTSFCPTTMTLCAERLDEIVTQIASFASNGSKIVGINLEGPYISPIKKGAQNEEFIRKGDINELESLVKKGKGLVKLITIAPEAFESEDFIRKASKLCTVSIGHSNANSNECQKAIDCGITHATHLYNAMTAMTHRQAGVVGTVADNEGVTCELICDGCHVSPIVLRNTFKMLGDDRIVAISDSMRAAGLGQGEFELGGQTVIVAPNGKCATLPDLTIAASITNLYEEFKNLISFGIDIKSALKACTINPARVIKEQESIGSISVGKCADLVVLDSNLNIKEVYINGILA